MENNIGLTSKEKAKAIYKWSLKKYLPFSIAYWILLFIAFPVVEFIAMATSASNVMWDADRRTAIEIYIEGMKKAVKYISGTGFVAVAVLFSTILGIMAFSYMHNKRSVDFFGSFPISRRTLFFARYLAVITAAIVPILIIGTIGALLTFNDSAMIDVFKNLGILVLAIIGNTSFIAFISVCCGTVADVIISYAVINAVYPICVALCYYFPRSVIPGMTDDFVPSAVFTMFTPIAASFVGMFGESKALHCVWWLVLSAVLAAGCYVLSKKRKAETAQSAFAFSAVEIVIKFVTCFVAGFGVGWMFSGIALESGRNVMQMQYIWFVIGLTMGVMVANILLHLIFHRGLSNYPSSLIECAVVGVSAIAFLLVVTSGGLGFDTRLPDEDKIEAVSIKVGGDESFHVEGKDILNEFKSDKDTVDIVYSAHKQIIELKEKTKHKGFYPIMKYYSKIETVEGDSTEEYSEETVSIQYKLSNGKTLKRKYEVNLNAINIPNKFKNDTINGAKKIELIPEQYVDWINFTKLDNGNTLASFSFWENEGNGVELEKIYEVVRALKKDIKEYGASCKEKEAKYQIDISYYSSSKAESTNAMIYIPRTYTNTIEALNKTGLANLGYYVNKKADYFEQEFESIKSDAELMEGRTIHFKLPSGWDKNLPVHCMPYREAKDEYDKEYIYQLTDIEDEITKCEKVTDNIWKYTIKVPKSEAAERFDRDINDYMKIKFYQIGDTDFNTTGIVKMPARTQNNLLDVYGLEDTYQAGEAPVEDGFDCIYEYKWNTYKNK